MRIVVALGGNALQRRGGPRTVESRREDVAVACRSLARVADEHELVVSHGSGPQAGVLGAHAVAYDDHSIYPFDVLGAQADGMIGYLIEQELGNLVPADKRLATVLTMTEVDPADPAFQNPTTFVGPAYTEKQAEKLVERHGWVFRRDGDMQRRVVPSPTPKRIVQIEPIQWLLQHGCVVACAGGGPPAMCAPGTTSLTGVEAVIDRDRASAVLAEDLHADLLVLATDVDAVYLDGGTPRQRALLAAHPDALDPGLFPAGSMRPKVEAAAAFARDTGRSAVIGSLEHLDLMIAGDGGTRISSQLEGVRTS